MVGFIQLSAILNWNGKDLPLYTSCPNLLQKRYGTYVPGRRMDPPSCDRSFVAKQLRGTITGAT
jgi:hypothetical protein